MKEKKTKKEMQVIAGGEKRRESGRRETVMVSGVTLSVTNDVAVIRLAFLSIGRIEGGCLVKCHWHIRRG